MIDFRQHAAQLEHELASVAIPALTLIERRIATPPALVDVAAAVNEALVGIALPGGAVAIGVGSRGIAQIGPIVAALVSALRRHGAQPFVVPAMGSHGASSAEGQVAVLEHLGVTEATVGAEIRATMETREVGKTPDGVPVYVDALAAAADAIVVVNRVKPHTSFRGPVESGPLKMLAVGLGKQDGARSIHAGGWGGMRTTVPAAARVVIERCPVAFGLAILENADEAPCRIVAVPAAELLEREPALLEEAKANLARLPLAELDVLVVDRVGKNISGGGGDPNVTGRFPSAFISGGPRVERLVYLALTPESDGNGNGIGLADVVTADLAERWNPLATYVNALTTTAAGNARLPMVMPTAELAVKAALRMVADRDPARASVVRVLDTLHLQRLWVSPAALEALAEETRVLATARAFEATGRYHA